VRSYLREYLPTPLVSKIGNEYTLDYSAARTIGRVKSFYGNSAVLLRAYCYILCLGKDGLKSVSEQAVLASNYLLSLLDKDAFSTPYSPKTPRKHEFVVSASPLKKRTGVSAGDVAKAILDQGMHSPTTYFPLIVAEALMVEPTETEAVENLEAYARALNEIASSASSNRESVIDSPKNTSIGRLDEYKASHPASMVLNWKKIPKSQKGQ
jgi:glycine dehydrogenase subunit 2